MKYNTFFLLTTFVFTSILASNGQDSLSAYDTAKKDILSEVMKSHEINDSISESKIVDKIFSLPEVKAKNRFIDSLSNHKRAISIVIMAKPNKKNKYYWVQAGDNNELRFEPYFNFYVMEHNLTVLFFDPVKNITLTLSQWRKKIKSK